MKHEILETLRCPETGSRLFLENPITRDADIVSGELVSEGARTRYPIVNSIPRFVKKSNYADSFGFQWTKFRETQLDSSSGLPISADRFYSFTGWSPAQLAGKRVLDVGCGAGRFAEVALAAGADVIAVDYSVAVDACWKNLGGDEHLTVVQADIYHLPFKNEAFDFIYCLGVLQHTPRVRDAFQALPPFLKHSGSIVIDLYPKLFRNLLWSKYWVRPITKRLPTDMLFALVERWTPALLWWSRMLSRVPVIGPKLRYAVPVVNYEGVYPLTADMLEQWAVLDTFDMLSPAFDQPQSESTIRKWFAEAGLREDSIERKGFLVARGTKY